MSCLHQHSHLNLIVSRADMLYRNVLASLLFHDLHTSRTTSSSHTTNKRGHTPIIDTRLVTHPHTTNRRISTKTRTPTPKTPPLARVRSSPAREVRFPRRTPQKHCRPASPPALPPAWRRAVGRRAWRVVSRTWGCYHCRMSRRKPISAMHLIHVSIIYGAFRKVNNSSIFYNTKF